MRELLPFRPLFLVCIFLGACLGSDLDSLTDDEPGAAWSPLAEGESPLDALAPTTDGGLTETDPELVADVLEALDALSADPENALARDREVRAELAEGAAVSREAVDVAWQLAAYLEATDPAPQTAPNERDAAALPSPDAHAGAPVEGDLH